MITPDRRPGPYHSPARGATAGRRAWVALGANMGDRRRTLSRALRWLSVLPGVTLEARSGLYETAAVGPPQPDYLNAVVRLRASLSPRRLLGALLALEAAAGRVRRPGERWGPRPLDLDLLAVEGRVVSDPPALILPHPRLHERAFVLEPWAEIDPALVVPGLDLSVAALLARLDEPPRRER